MRRRNRPVDEQVNPQINPARPSAGTEEIEQEKTEGTEFPMTVSVIFKQNSEKCSYPLGINIVTYAMTH
jgi:hypothetical protein